MEIIKEEGDRPFFITKNISHLPQASLSRRFDCTFSRMITKLFPSSLNPFSIL